jgi:hypothetical protein
MKRTVLAGLAALYTLAVLASAAPAVAMMVAPAPIPQRVATADVVVVGKVTGFADKSVSAPRFPGDTVQAEYQVALVKVEDALLGTRGMKEIRVGFIPPPAPVPDARPVRPPIRRFPSVNLTLNQEVCLFLTRHPAADFYTAPAYYHVLNKTGNANFARELGEVKRCAKLLADPKAGLDSKDKDECFLTAAMLITRYRTPNLSRAGLPKTEPVDAAQSKRILEALAEADWAVRNPRQAQMAPQNLFFRLGLKPADGWTQPRDYRETPAAAKKWLQDHAGTYRVQRYVAEKPDQK